MTLQHGFPQYWPLVRRIQRSLVGFLTNSQRASNAALWLFVSLNKISSYRVFNTMALIRVINYDGITNVRVFGLCKIRTLRKRKWGGGGCRSEDEPHTNILWIDSIIWCIIHQDISVTVYYVLSCRQFLPIPCLKLFVHWPPARQFLPSNSAKLDAISDVNACSNQAKMLF